MTSQVALVAKEVNSKGEQRQLIEHDVSYINVDDSENWMDMKNELLMWKNITLVEKWRIHIQRRTQKNDWAQGKKIS